LPSNGDEIIATVVDLLQVTRMVLIRRYILSLVGKYGGSIPLMGIQVVSFVVYFTALSLEQAVYRRMVVDGKLAMIWAQETLLSSRVTFTALALAD
jgi:hypothetical protein